MYTKPRYSLKNMMLWTREDTLLFLAISAVPVILYELVGLKWLHLPWLPVALIGTAVAFIISFQNNATSRTSMRSRTSLPSFSRFSRRSYVSSSCEV